MKKETEIQKLKKMINDIFDNDIDYLYSVVRTNLTTGEKKVTTLRGLKEWIDSDLLSDYFKSYSPLSGRVLIGNTLYNIIS